MPDHLRSPNDIDELVDHACARFADRLGPEVPPHFTAFYPDDKMMGVAPTPPATLTRARTIGLGNGRHHVYTGNVHDVEGGTTFCPGCHAALVRRDWSVVLSCRIDTQGGARGICPHCGFAVAGHFGVFGGGFDRRWIPVRVAA